MSHALVKLVAMLLLFAQGLVAIAPGRVVCIPVQDCGTHEQDGHALCGHCDPLQCNDGIVADACDEHSHGPFSSVAHPDDECGCHVHVLVPDAEQLPGNPRGDNSDLRHAIVPLLFAVVLAWDSEPAFEVVERFKPPDVSVSDQVLALKATRLLI